MVYNKDNVGTCWNLDYRAVTAACSAGACRTPHQESQLGPFPVCSFVCADLFFQHNCTGPGGPYCALQAVTPLSGRYRTVLVWQGKPGQANPLSLPHIFPQRRVIGNSDITSIILRWSLDCFGLQLPFHYQQWSSKIWYWGKDAHFCF